MCATERKKHATGIQNPFSILVLAKKVVELEGYKKQKLKYMHHQIMNSSAKTPFFTLSVAPHDFTTT